MNSAANLEIVLSLMRALSHKIRTPLSVISNDLNYFKSLIEPSECERAILKCRQISDFFKPVQLLQSTQEGSESFSLSELLGEILGEKLKFSKSENDIYISGVRNNLTQAIKWFLELFEIDSVQLIKVQDSKLKVNFQLLKPLKLSADTSSKILHDNKFTITELYCNQAADDSIFPMLIDSILLSFSAECGLNNNSEIQVTFSEVRQ